MALSSDTCWHIARLVRQLQYDGLISGPALERRFAEQGREAKRLGDESSLKDLGMLYDCVFGEQAKTPETL